MCARPSTFKCQLLALDVYASANVFMLRPIIDKHCNFLLFFRALDYTILNRL